MISNLSAAAKPFGTEYASNTSPGRSPAFNSKPVEPPIREVSNVSLYFLQHEFIQYLFETRCAVQESSSTNSLASEDVLNRNKSRDECTAILSDAGFHLGVRLHERLILTKNRIWDARECVKFICKDVWIHLFQKQADRLQTNRKGGFVIFDNNLPPLRYVPIPVPCGDASDDSAAGQIPFVPYHHTAEPRLVYVCGIIRGALTNFGFQCTVISECTSPPSCKCCSSIQSPRVPLT